MLDEVKDIEDQLMSGMRSDRQYPEEQHDPNQQHSNEYVI